MDDYYFDDDYDTCDDANYYEYDEKEVLQYDSWTASEIKNTLQEIERCQSGRKLYKKFIETINKDHFYEDDYYFCIEEMREKNPTLRAVNLLVLVLVLMNKADKNLNGYAENNGKLMKEVRELKEENDSLRKKLNGRQYQIDQVKSGKAKPAYRDDITPEKVQVLYDKLKNKCAVARELKVDRRLVDRRLMEMQKRNGGSKKQ